MSQGTVNRVTFDAAAHTALRVMIASYFLAVALSLIPGTDLGLLFAIILPEPYSSAVAAGLVFLFSFMIMIGIAMRLAALMIALITFFASYLTMVQLGVQNELGSYWRDIALIAALLLTYSEPKLGRARSRKVLHREIVPRRIDAIMKRAAFHEPEMPDFRSNCKARKRRSLDEDAPTPRGMDHVSKSAPEQTRDPQIPATTPSPQTDAQVVFKRRAKQAAPVVSGEDADCFNIFAAESKIA